MNNHYETLGLPPSAEPPDIKKAYFDLAKKYHPDSGDETEVKKFHEITAAYKTLSDKELKKAYDLTLKTGLEVLESVENKLTKNPANPSHYSQKRETYRDVELQEFHQNRLKKAKLRVIGFTLVWGGLAALVDWLLGGRWYFGLLVGILMGFSISIRENFDLTTFFETKSSQVLFTVFCWLALIGGVTYFVFLLAGFVVR